MIDISGERICFVLHLGTIYGLRHFLGVSIALLVISAGSLVFWIMRLLVLMKRATFCLLVFRIGWIYWKRGGVCDLSTACVLLRYSFLCFSMGVLNASLITSASPSSGLLLYRKNGGSRDGGGRDSPKPDLLQRFLQLEVQFAIQSPGFYHLNNHAPHWGLVPQERHRTRQEKTSQQAGNKEHINWELVWRLVRVCVFVNECLRRISPTLGVKLT